MDTTIVLARISGIMCLLLGLSVMNKKFMAAVVDDMLNSKALFWFIGFVAAMIGAVVLAFYNIWNAHWPVLITILGWLALLKGIAIMLFPGSMSHSVYRKFKTSGIIMFSGIISILFGIILLYKGFIG
jgi:uncharacterized membrane protein HdeD (DUF308 family)